ncbi:HNH endonuclease [Pseudoalteromonas maricaloris]|uniref:HNH endonuclease n=1 Tax=Pseudoalteromonas maricaloris TaxID=184924 RepID=UPI002948B7E2|nr:HNH endonuclease signature motif containing protein [Pseudoalteromonas flavipulchra]
MNEREVAKLADGKVPKGWQVHHKIPLDDGGTNSFNNLVLIRNSPEHSVFTTYQKK